MLVQMILDTFSPASAEAQRAKAERVLWYEVGIKPLPLIASNRVRRDDVIEVGVYDSKTMHS